MVVYKRRYILEESNILNREVLSVMREKYESLSLAERKVADFVVKNPHKTVDCNVAELAKLSGVSDATIVRMCHDIGYTGYYQFRITLARDIGKNQYGDIKVSNNTDEIEVFFREYAENMIAIGKRLDAKTMWNCVNLIRSCGMAHIIAVGNTIPLSQYIGFRLGRLGVKSSFGLSAEYYMNHINLAEKNDIIMAISKSGASKPILMGMELAKEKGLKCIAITSYEDSPVAEMADYVLISRGKDISFNYYKDYAHTNMMATIDALLEFLTNEEFIRNKQADRPEIILSEYKV